MRPERTLGRILRTCGLLAVVLGLGACGSDAKKTPDAAVAPDTAPDVARISDSPLAPETGTDVADARPDVAVGLPDAAPDTAPDAAADAGDAAYVCPPLPTATVPSGTAPMQDPGPAAASTPTRPQLSAALADSEYTIAKTLAQGGTMTGPPTPAVVAPVDGGASDGGGASVDGGGGPVDAGSPADAITGVSYEKNDNWDPVQSGIGDVGTFSPLFTVASDGSGTHTSVNQAVADANAIPKTDCARVYIRIKAGTYRGKVVVAKKSSAPMLTLYSTEADAAQTVLVNALGAEEAGSMSSTATMTVSALGGFQMKNLTVANDFAEVAGTSDDQTAVALLVQGDRAQFENVRFLGNIATLYVKSESQSGAARSYFRDCYVEGDQDIITGRGVAVFDHTEVRYLASRQPTGGVIANPSTVLNSRYGMLFVSCNFTAETGASDVVLGHQWWEGGNNASIGKVIVRNSTLGGHIAASPWAPSPTRTFTPKDPAGTTPVALYTSDDYYPAGTGPSPAEIYLGEYGNVGPGAAQ
jgi:pectinesterase